ncbi:hypothetical protein [Paraflavitalea sp. CAU 1676]|uniref:hypothetical protein n=1 Tax=Paraflavitalea sp. CAU 1676 TaxID=3032598 RepID=UPI0023DCCD9C|nr:hypothetical protein [Paraflavitalea sp. CAU 1676]
MNTAFRLSPTIPPPVEQVRIYFNQKGMTSEEAECFFLFYEKKGWKGRRGDFLKNWKNPAYQWIACILKHEPWRYNKSIH